MAFCEVFGITVPCRKNSWPGKPQFVGDELGRGAAGVLEDHFVRRVREWAGVKLVFQEPETGHALRRLLEGEFIHFDFDADMLAHCGEGPASGGGYTRSNTGGKHGGKVAVSSGSHLPFDLADALGVEGGWEPTQGWTVIVWKKLTTADDGVGGAGTYYHHIATGDVAVTQGASANPAGVTQYRDGVAGSFSMGNWLDVTAAGVVRLHGKDNDGTNNAKDYDELVVFPFKLPSARAATWAAALFTWMDEHAFGDAPFVMLSGDCIPDLLPLAVRVTVTGEENVNATLLGVHYNNCLELELVVREADPVTPREPPGQTVEELIVADPDLFLYYPLTDASNPATVADLGPGGYDLDVYNADNVLSFGAPGPTAEVPLWLATDYDFPNDGAYNYLAVDEDVGPVHPPASITVGFVLKGTSYQTNFTVSLLYGWDGHPSGSMSGNQIDFNVIGSEVVWYIGNKTLIFTSVPNPNTTEKIYELVLDTAAQSASLYISGALHQTLSSIGSYIPPNQARTVGVLFLTNAYINDKCPPSNPWLTAGYGMEGGLAHWFMATRARSAADALALAQAAGFA